MHTHAISNVELDRNIAEHIHSISPLICTYDFDPRSNLSAPELSFISAEPVRTWTAEKQIEICSVLAFILNLLAYLICNEKRLNIFVADTRLHDDCAKGWTDASVDEALLCRRRTRELQPDTVPAAQPAQPRRSTEHHYCALTIPYSRPTTPLPAPPSLISQISTTTTVICHPSTAATTTILSLLQAKIINRTGYF